MAIRELTVKERILLHLFDFNRFAEEYEAPQEVTQGGIAKAVGIRVHHVTQYVRPLISEDLVEEKVSHITRKPRRRKVYFLSSQGRHRVASMRNSLFNENVPFRTRDGTIQELPLSRIYQEDRRGTRLSGLLDELHSMAFISEVVEAAAPGLVDFTQEAPHLDQFYGREEELEEIMKALERPLLVVITGIAGIGKTALGSKVCEELRGSQSLFWRRIRPWDRAVNLSSRLAGFLKALGRPKLDAYLRASGRELSQVEDILLMDLPGVHALLVFDDVHEAREDAKDFLTLLNNVLRQQEGCSALLLSRTPPPFYSRRDVDVDASVVELSLSGLDAASAGRFLSHAGVREALFENLIDLSGGIPLFLKVLTKAGTLEGVTSASKTLDAYIAEEIEPSFSEEERDCLRIASLYEVPVSASGLLLEKSGGMGTVLGLQKKGFLDQLETGELLLHDFLRSYVQQGIPSERKRSLSKKAVLWLQEETERAAESGMPQDAIPYLENGLMLEVEPSRQLSILERLGELRGTAADFPGAVEAYRAALESVHEPTARARLYFWIGGNLGFLDPKAAQVEVEKGLRLLALKPSLEAAWLLYLRGWLASQTGDFKQALEDLERVQSWIPGLPAVTGLPPVPILEGRLASARGWIHLFDPDRWDLALAKADLGKALELFEAAGDRRRLSESHPGEALPGPPIMIPHPVIAYADLQMGRVDEALAHIQRAIALCEEQGNLLPLLLARRMEAWVHSECLGNHERGEAIYREVYPLLKKIPLELWGAWLHRSFADLFRRQGRNVEAKESLEYLLAHWGEDLDGESKIENLSLLARLCVLCEESEAASSNLGEAEKAGTATDSDFARFSIHWARGVLRGSQGELREAQESFQQAFDLSSERPRIFAGTPKHLATSGHRWEFLLDYARFLASTGDGKRAKELLLKARAELRTLNRKPLELEARKVLRSLDSA